MNIGINNPLNGIPASRLAESAISEAHRAMEENAADGLLSVTTAPASPEDIAAAEIPESALSRDDDLGKLVGGAFNLPPPAMPAFDHLIV